MRAIGTDRPHIRRMGDKGCWWCAMRGVIGTGVGYTPGEAFKDWNAWVYKPQVGHSFKPVSGKNSSETVKG